MSDKILSVFIDESGDFGNYEAHSPFYLVAMVFHDQSINISGNIVSFNSRIKDCGYRQHAVHTAPLIRRESIYINDSRDQRRHLFQSLFHFARKLNFKYSCAMIRKSPKTDVISMTAQLSKEISNILRSHEKFLNGYDKVLI